MKKNLVIALALFCAGGLPGRAQNIDVLPVGSDASDGAALIMRDGDGIATARISSEDLGSADFYGWSVQPVKYEVKTDILLSPGSMRNINSLVSAGEYSGIVGVGENSYAVVHDKFNGGGIVFFDIRFDSSGNVRSIKESIPSATSDSGAQRDVEGITYIGGKLLVSGESDQKILEYDLDGKPTGRGLEIPLDMGKGFVQSNNGFESLTSNEKTGLIWTTTECALEKDMEYCPLENMGSLMRIQSFSAETYKPQRRYLYLMDKAQETEIYLNYVHGISDMLALDDGKLIVMEREVNADVSKFVARTHTKLYLIDPVNDKGGILSKTLIYSFDNGNLETANFEGMCLGPDGTILLINDSQGRKKFFAGLISLNDYIFTLRYNVWTLRD